MERYVVHRGMHCQVVEDGWVYKEWRSSATGQAELKLWPRVRYIPLSSDPDDPDVLAGPPVDQTGTLVEAERLERARLLALEKSARRAKQTCSHKIKEAGFHSLLTCTYRDNMQDFDKLRADWQYMLRRLRAAIPGFSAVFAFERQSRGAWHVHAAIYKLPAYLWVPRGKGDKRLCMVRSWDYIRRVWRSICGDGNIDVDGHRRKRDGRAGASLAKLAGYVSKYLTKDHATGPEGRNRWGSTAGITPPKPAIRYLPPMAMAEAIQLAFHVPDGHRIARHAIWGFGKFWCLYTEPEDCGETDTVR